AVDGELTLNLGSGATALPNLSPRGQAALADAATDQAGRVLGVRTAQADAGPAAPGASSALGLQFSHVMSGQQSAVESQWTVGPGVSSTLLGSRFAGGGTLRLKAVTEGDALYLQLPSTLGAQAT